MTVIRKSTRNFPVLSELPRSCCYLSITAALLLGVSIARAEKIRTAIPQANLNYLSIYVADAKGFFKDEGLENETVVISDPLSIAALLSGDVDYSGAGGSAQKEGLVSLGFLAIFFRYRFRASSPRREKFATIRRRSSAGSRGRSAA